MPVLTGVDLTSVSTDRQAFPEGEYRSTVIETKLSDDKKNLIITHKLTDPTEYIDRQWQHWINLVQNDGKPNRIGAEAVKRYFEAKFGKGSAEAETANPDTDTLVGSDFCLFLSIREYDDKKEKDVSGQPVKKQSNELKRIWV